MQIFKREKAYSELVKAAKTLILCMGVKIMLARFLRIFLVTILLLGTYVTVVQASDGGGQSSDAGYAQTPIQTIVQIVITAIVLRILQQFDLP